MIFYKKEKIKLPYNIYYIFVLILHEAPDVRKDVLPDDLKDVLLGAREDDLPGVRKSDFLGVRKEGRRLVRYRTGEMSQKIVPVPTGLFLLPSPIVIPSGVPPTLFFKTLHVYGYIYIYVYIYIYINTKLTKVTKYTQSTNYELWNLYK